MGLLSISLFPSTFLIFQTVKYTVFVFMFVYRLYLMYHNKTSVVHRFAQRSMRVSMFQTRILKYATPSVTMWCYCFTGVLLPTINLIVKYYGCGCKSLCGLFRLDMYVDALCCILYMFQINHSVCRKPSNRFHCTLGAIISLRVIPAETRPSRAYGYGGYGCCEKTDGLWHILYINCQTFIQIFNNLLKGVFILPLLGIAGGCQLAEVEISSTSCLNFSYIDRC